MRRLSLAPLVALAACSGASAPPPPVARATASPASDDLRPLSSRDSGGPLVPPPAATPGAAPSLPPGHPPIGGADPHGNVATGGPVKSAGSITGSITIAPKLRSGPSDVLYVMAKRGPSTIAVRRVDKPSFPFAFEISGVDAMVSGIGFEGRVDVVARLSKTGDAIPSKGDLEGTARNVKVPAKGVSITIDSVRQ